MQFREISLNLIFKYFFCEIDLVLDFTSFLAWTFLNFLVHSYLRQKFFLPAIPNCESIILQNTLSISRILDAIIQCGNGNIASSIDIFFSRFEKSNAVSIGAEKCTSSDTTTFSKCLFGTHPILK